LDNVLDLIGRTDQRQLIRLTYHAVGGLGPSTYLQHLMAAWEKPYVCLLGGREPVTWVQYPKQTTLHTMGALDCCRNSACWKSRVVPIDKLPEKNTCLCKFPVLGLKMPVAKCMAMIKPEEVLLVLDKYI
jgi:ADP-heptose:LPS heptosyltransferase